MTATHNHDEVLSFLEANGSDAELLVGLIRKYYEFDHIPFLEKEIRAGLSAFLRDPSIGSALLVTRGREVLGYTIFTYCFDLELGGRMAAVTDLYLEEAHRGKGLGLRILEKVEGFCRESGVLAIELRVEKNNPRAFALYKKFGFRTYDRISMSKRIV